MILVSLLHSLLELKNEISKLAIFAVKLATLMGSRDKPRHTIVLKVATMN